MSLATLPSRVSMRIVPRPAVRLAGVRIRTNMQHAPADVEKLWHDVMPRISQLVSGRQGKIYGISWFIDPASSSFDYCAAVPTGRNPVLPEEFEETIIPAGLYAECTLPSREELHRFIDYLYREWLPEQDSDAQIGDTPCYEVYPDDFHRGGHMKLYIPIVSG